MFAPDGAPAKSEGSRDFGIAPAQVRLATADPTSDLPSDPRQPAKGGGRASGDAGPGTAGSKSAPGEVLSDAPDPQASGWQPGQQYALLGKSPATEGETADAVSNLLGKIGNTAKGAVKDVTETATKAATSGAVRQSLSGIAGKLLGASAAFVTTYFDGSTAGSPQEHGKSPQGDRVTVDERTISISYADGTQRTGANAGADRNSWSSADGNLIARRNTASGEILIAPPGQPGMSPNAVPAGAPAEPGLGHPDTDLFFPPDPVTAVRRAAPAAQPVTGDDQTGQQPATAKPDSAGGKLPPTAAGTVRPDGECDENGNIGPRSPAARLPNKNGHWLGKPGNSPWQSTDPRVNAVTGGKPVNFVNGRADFTPWARMSINFGVGELTGFDAKDQGLARRALDTANHPDVQAAGSAYKFMFDNQLTAHHATDTCLQIVPKALNNVLPHIGSASDIRYQGTIGWTP